MLSDMEMYVYVQYVCASMWFFLFYFDACMHVAFDLELNYTKLLYYFSKCKVLLFIQNTVRNKNYIAIDPVIRHMNNF